MRLISLQTAPILAAAISLLTLSACSPLQLVDKLVPDTGYERETGIAYGDNPRQKLDVYRPLNDLKSKTVIVFLYGGSWKSGARQHYRFVGQTLSTKGFVTVIPDYRLYPEVRFPEFVEDAAAAIAWVHREIAGRGGDPDRIVIVGHSAGAHSAALLALDRTYLEKAGVPQAAIAGWIGLAGPYVFDPLKYANTRKVFENASNPDVTRPIKNVRAGAPPALLIHGVNDWTVDIRNSIELTRSMRAVGVPTRYVALEDTGHSGILLGLAKPFMAETEIVKPISDFIALLDDRALAQSR
jgi:acetyl esterase/lipase